MELVAVSARATDSIGEPAKGKPMRFGGKMVLAASIAVASIFALQQSRADNRDFTLASESAFCFGVLPLERQTIIEYLASAQSDWEKRTFSYALTHINLSLESSRMFVLFAANSEIIDIVMADKLRKRGEESFKRCAAATDDFFEGDCNRGCLQNYLFQDDPRGWMDECKVKCGIKQVETICSRPRACSDIHKRIPF